MRNGCCPTTPVSLDHTSSTLSILHPMARNIFRRFLSYRSCSVAECERHCQLELKKAEMTRWETVLKEQGDEDHRWKIAGGSISYLFALNAAVPENVPIWILLGTGCWASYLRNAWCLPFQSSNKITRLKTQIHHLEAECTK